MKKRFLSLVLALSLMMGAVPAYAVGTETEPAPAAEEDVQVELMETGTQYGDTPFYYTENGDGTVSISDCKTSAKGEIVIPSEINGMAVTAIGEDAFYNCTSLTSITIPDSVTSIGNGVFSSCENLANVIIPDSVTSIGKQAFIDCSGLTSITIPDSVTSIGERAFSFCTGLTSITIPNSVTSISCC